jgi:NAD-dependent dihydropyrimidine dehydrogenase PreA subunit
MNTVQTKSHESCSGCSLCLLVCPVWHARRDIRHTPQGRAKALQMGVPVAALAESIESCTLCAACEPACPESLPLVDMMLDLREQLARDVPARLPEIDWSAGASPRLAAAECLLPDAAMLQRPALLDRAAKLLGGMPVAEDAGLDIAEAIEGGQLIPQERLYGFLQALKRARRLVVANGLLAHRLRDWLPTVRIDSLAMALGALEAVRSRIQPGDFYVIESRHYHADRERLVHHYDGLRQRSGCSMNLDLQRLAVPTTAASGATQRGQSGIDVLEQARWILEGATPARIVVEDAADLAVFAAVSDKPVLHLAELGDDAAEAHHAQPAVTGAGI